MVSPEYNPTCLYALMILSGHRNQEKHIFVENEGVVPFAGTYAPAGITRTYRSLQQI
jgi:hypothetical protein